MHPCGSFMYREEMLLMLLSLRPLTVVPLPFCVSTQKRGTWVFSIATHSWYMDVFFSNHGLWSYSCSSVFLKYLQMVMSPPHTGEWPPVVHNTSGDSASLWATGVCMDGMTPCLLHVELPSEPALPGTSLRTINLWLSTALEVSNRGWRKYSAFCLYSLWVCEEYTCLTVWRTYESISLYPDACFSSLQIFFWSC